MNSLLIIIAAIIAVAQVLLLNSYSTIGDKLTSFSKEIEDIQRENANLSQKIASVSALSMISFRAEKLSLNKSLPLFSFTAPIPVAYNLGPSM